MIQYEASAGRQVDSGLRGNNRDKAGTANIMGRTHPHHAATPLRHACDKARCHAVEDLPRSLRDSDRRRACTVRR